VKLKLGRIKNKKKGEINAGRGFKIFIEEANPHGDRHESNEFTIGYEFGGRPVSDAQ